MRNRDQWNSLTPENLPNIPGVFEPLWVDYTTSNKPYTDMRYSKTGSLSSSGEYFDGKLRSLVGVRKDEFQLKRYKLPEGSIAELVDEFGELAWWGQDVFAGSPDEAPEFYEYVPELNQSATTFSAGLVYEINEDVNVYANVSESFRWQGTENFLGEILGPEGGKTKEIGFKGELFNDAISFTAAAFDIDRENVAFRYNTNNSANELELLLNDVTIDIGPDGTMSYIPAEPGSPGFVEIARGLNQEHRQVTAAENSRGYEFTILLKRTHGLQARVAFSHIEIESTRDLSKYVDQLAIAEERATARAAIVAANWPNDPNFMEGSLPGIEADLQEYLADARNVVASNSGTGLITGSRARPYMASWILDYQIPNGFLPNTRVILSGRWADDYLLSTTDGVEWIGGATHPVDLTFAYRTNIDEKQLDIRLKFSDLHDFENNKIKAFDGFVDEFNGERRLRYRNIRPMSVDLTASIKF